MNHPRKIIVCLAEREEQRIEMIAKLLVEHHFARIKSDAKKIIRQSPYDIDLAGAYFVAASSFNFRTSANTAQRLFEMALRGNLILLGARKVPPEMEFLCEVYYP